MQAFTETCVIFGVCNIYICCILGERIISSSEGNENILLSNKWKQYVLWEEALYYNRVYVKQEITLMGKEIQDCHH